MANKSKIVGEIKDKVLKLHNEGYNPTHISKNIPIKASKDTIKSFLLSMNLTPHIRKQAIKADAYGQFIEELKKDPDNWSVKRKKYNISFELAKTLMEKNGIYIRDRAESARSKSLTEADIRDRLGDETILLSVEEGIYKLQCEEGHVYYKDSTHIHQGCPVGKSGTKTNTDELKKELFKIGYELIDGTFNKKRKALKAIHLKCGNIRENRYRNFFTQDCPVCNNNGVSKEELSLKEWIESLGFQTEKYKFEERVTRPKEIDVYIPSIKVGFEYCGVYDHCEESRHPRGEDSHNWKRLNAQKNGIRLFTIYSNEWKERNYQVKSFIKSALDKNEKKIYARECSVKEIDKEYGQEFLKTYHIQGHSNAIFYQGLFFNEELVGVMSFSYHHRDINSPFIILSRLCFKANYSIIGGASKLLESSKIKIKQLGYSSIKTWSDNRWSEGRVYEKMGFTLEEEMKPSFDYVKGSKVFSKQSLKLTEEDKKLNMTEEALRKSQGYMKIWDCGKKRWVLHLI